MTCSTWKRPAYKERELDLSEWKRVGDVFFNNGITNVELFGGDVLLRNDMLIPFIKYLKEKDFVIYLPTNSNLIDEKMAFDLVEASVDRIYLSTDGLTVYMTA